MWGLMVAIAIHLWRWVIRENRSIPSPQEQVFFDHTRLRAPAGGRVPAMANPLSDTSLHEIIPGERIGPFRLGVPWASIDAILTDPYRELADPAFHYIEVGPYVFELNPSTKSVAFITAYQGYAGSLANTIGIGSTLLEVTRVFQTGIFRLDRFDDVFLQKVSGVSFLVDGPSSKKKPDSTLLQRKIEAIKIFEISHDT